MSFPPARLLVLVACAGAVSSGAARTTTLPANVAVTPPGGRIHGGDLAVDPRDRDRLAAVYWDERPARRGTCSIAVSSDSGGSWTSQPFAGVGSGNPLPAGATLCRAVTVAFASDGMLYAVYEAASLSGFAQIELARSSDGGTTFAPPLLLDPDVTAGGDHDPSIAVGRRPGRVYVSFAAYDADEERADVVVVASADGGRTVSAWTRVGPEDENAAGSRPALAVDRSGVLRVAWVDGSGVDLDAGTGTARIEVAASRDGGRSFGAPVTVADVPGGCGPNDDCGNRYPSASIAATGAGALVVAWSAGAYPAPARVFTVRSRTGGRRWTRPRAVPLPRGIDADRDQYAPELSAAPDGRVDLAYLIRRRDADSGIVDVSVVRSLDGGATFSRPLLLDDRPSDSQVGDFEPAVSVGSSDGAVAATWIDGRRGDAANPATDVFFAAVADAGAPRAPLVLGPSVVRDGPAVYRLLSTDAFTPAAALRFRCAFDGAPLRPCAARVTQRLAPGRHVFRVRALDPAGNRSTLSRREVLVRARTP